MIAAELEEVETQLRKAVECVRPRGPDAMAELKGFLAGFRQVLLDRIVEPYRTGVRDASLRWPGVGPAF